MQNLDSLCKDHATTEIVMNINFIGLEQIAGRLYLEDLLLIVLPEQSYFKDLLRKQLGLFGKVNKRVPYLFRL